MLEILFIFSSTSFFMVLGAYINEERHEFLNRRLLKQHTAYRVFEERTYTPTDGAYQYLSRAMMRRGF